MAQAYFLVMALGVPLLLLILAIVAGASYRGSYATLLDWRPTRSPQREAELQHDDVDQMLAALNRYRRRRGAPEVTTGSSNCRSSNSRKRSKSFICIRNASHKGSTHSPRKSFEERTLPEFGTLPRARRRAGCCAPGAPRAPA